MYIFYIVTYFSTSYVHFYFVYTYLFCRYAVSKWHRSNGKYIYQNSYDAFSQIRFTVLILNKYNNLRRMNVINDNLSVSLSIKHTIREFNDKEFDLTIASKINLEYNDNRSANFVIFSIFFSVRNLNLQFLTNIYIYMIIVLKFFTERQHLQFIFI